LSKGDAVGWGSSADRPAGRSHSEGWTRFLSGDFS